jgi:hypothetical protein
VCLFLSLDFLERCLQALCLRFLDKSRDCGCNLTTASIRENLAVCQGRFAYLTGY